MMGLSLCLPSEKQFLNMNKNFQGDVLNLVKQIPQGKVTTYGEIARELTGSVGAARAVGQAVAKNPYPIIKPLQGLRGRGAEPHIPCHRVVKSDGDIGGYSLGVDTKIRLLREEGIEIKGGKVANFEKTLFRFKGKTLRFVTDRMLGKLSTWLRILGYDTVYAADIPIKNGEEDEDNAIAAFAACEARILLTRDKNLAASARKKGVQCLQIRTAEVMEQLRELFHHNLAINLEPVPVRCSECNARIRKVEAGKENVLKGKNYVPTSRIGKCDFWVCERCGRIYWEGSHWRNIRAQLRQLNGLKPSGV
ncbi:MAG: MGMT family protein [Methanosarcinales archaeon]|nr:MGMT family protein [Methanosarcinales archaeon]